MQVNYDVPGERVRIVVEGRSTEDGSQCTVLVIKEEIGTWVMHGLGNQGVLLSATDMLALAEAIVACRR